MPHVTYPDQCILERRNIGPGFDEPYRQGWRWREELISVPSLHLHPLRFHIERIERLAGRHEQPIALDAPEADVGAFGCAWRHVNKQPTVGQPGKTLTHTRLRDRTRKL
jgi:hypothetical protein